MPSPGVRTPILHRGAFRIDAWALGSGECLDSHSADRGAQPDPERFAGLRVRKEARRGASATAHTASDTDPAPPSSSRRPTSSLVVPVVRTSSTISTSMPFSGKSESPGPRRPYDAPRSIRRPRRTRNAASDRASIANRPSFAARAARPRPDCRDAQRATTARMHGRSISRATASAICPA